MRTRAPRPVPRLHALVRTRRGAAEMLRVRVVDRAGAPDLRLSTNSIIEVD